MKIATARQKTSKRWKTADISWEQFLERLRTPLRTGETAREYRAMCKAERDQAKEAAGGFVGGALDGGQRKTEAVRERYLLTLDADHAKVGAWKTGTMMLDCRMACYSTHSHTPENPRIRWVIPTDRPMTPDEYPAVARRVAQWLDIETMDPTTYEVARLMYWPTCSKDAEYEFHEQDGPLLKVDDVLHLYGDGDAWKDTTQWPIAKAEQEIRLSSLRKAGDPREKRGIVGLFCRTFAVEDAIDAFLPDVYLPTDKPGRYTFAGGSTAAGAILYNGGQFLYSNHATDPCGGQCVNAFDLVRIHKFRELDDDAGTGTDVTKLPSYHACCKWAAELPEVKRQLAEENMASFEEEMGDLAGMQPEEQPDKEWYKGLSANSKTGEVDPLIDNALLILRNDPRLAGAIGNNVFSARRTIRKPLPWHPVVADARNGDNWQDSDDSSLRWYMEKVWKLKGRATVEDALNIILEENRYDPVKDYLDGLKWDGQERLDTVLVRLFGAEDCPYVRAVTRKWCVAGVRRIYEPGCKFDTMLVLISAEQGTGKSSFGRIMGRGWYTGSHNTVSGKDAFDQLRGKWVVEVAEMTATRKAENEAIKQYYAQQVDSYRPAYGRNLVDFPRRCVFIGTSNDKEFIKDETGGRRYWPVEIEAGRVDVVERLDRLEAEVDQLWAEAVVRYRAGEKTYEDTDELLTLALAAQANASQEDEWKAMIDQYLDTPLPDNWDEMSAEARRDYIQGDDLTTPEARASFTRRRNRVSVAEIRYELFNDDPRRGGGGNVESSRHVARLMNVMPGWRRAKNPLATAFGRQRCFVREGCGVL